MNRSRLVDIRRWVGLCAGLAGAVCAGQAHASEGGVSFYLLGSGGPEAAIMPPFEGVYFDSTTYFFQGSAKASRTFQINGIVVAGVNAETAADFGTVLWVPTTQVAGGTLGLGVALPFGEPNVEVGAIISGPRGNTIGLRRKDSAFLVGDPLLTGELGWAWGDFHLQGSTLINVPVGQYRENRLANLSFHRWAEDVSLAGTWHNDKSGWDVSGKAGVTFNGQDFATDYDTGDESHYELSLEKTLAKAWAVNAQAYYFDQITGDSGPGDRIGPFEGRVAGVGGSLTYNFTFANRPSILRFRGLTEFDSKDRISGPSYWLEWSFPLSMKLPPAPPGGPGAPHLD